MRASFRRQGLMRLLGTEVVSAGRRLFVCKAEVVAVEDGEERACANLLQTVSLAPVRGEPAGPGGGA